MNKQNDEKAPGKRSSKFSSIRISRDTRRKLENILLIANKKAIGRKIKIEQALNLAIELVEEKHIKELQNRSMTNEDRKELLRQKYVELRGSISKDEFTGFMMKSEFLEFVKEADIQPEVR